MRMESKERSKSSRPSVAALVKGYVGFLVGTGKSSSTISSYKGDLELFEKFLREKKRDFYRLQPRDIESYQVWLEKAGKEDEYASPKGAERQGSGEVRGES